MSEDEKKQFENSFEEAQSSVTVIDNLMIQATTVYADHPDQSTAMSHLKHLSKFYNDIRTEIHKGNLETE